jgi:plasmid rolling circle replication initiator protein Rep
MLAANEQNSNLENQPEKFFSSSASENFQSHRASQNSHSLINGFRDVGIQTPKQKPELCPKEKAKLKYKQDLAGDVVAALNRSSENPLMRAQAVRIERCCSDDNLFVGEDFHTSDGELFSGKGSLWACNSRLCPSCVGKLSKRNRRIMRYVIENQKLLVGENWYVVNFTLPNLNLKDVELPLIAEIMQAAWKRFSALETRANKKPTWFQKTVRGGFKNCEFTYTKNDVYHYHLHTLLVAKSKIQRDNFVEIRRQWTKALVFAFDKFGIDLKINSKDGLANVFVEKRRFNSANREKTINELAKYVTKNESWSEIPIDQLETVVAVPRFWRMFESFGVCRQTARAMNERSVQASENAEFENVNGSANLNNDAYLDTKELINRRENESLEKGRRERRVSWRIRVREIPLWQYRMELADEVEEVQRFRKFQLQRKFEFATFQTLDGEVF